MFQGIAQNDIDNSSTWNSQMKHERIIGIICIITKTTEIFHN